MTARKLPHQYAVEAQERTVENLQNYVERMQNLPGMQPGREALQRDADANLRIAKKQLELLKHPPKPKPRVDVVKETIEKIDRSIDSGQTHMVERRKELVAELQTLTNGQT